MGRSRFDRPKRSSREPHASRGKTESYPPNFRAANGCPKVIADLILYSKRHICPSENNSNQSVLLLRKSVVKSLAFTAIKSEYLSRFKPAKQIFRTVYN